MDAGANERININHATTENTVGVVANYGVLDTAKKNAESTAVHTRPT